ncbi:MAG: hypothetical protein J6386_20210 [Candidatus Synoicihabitans palmerolidicus]|nr:hypothetical protein [Candidatus Synoicihabitans palmerolidicus]
MHDGFLRALQTQRSNLRQRWEALLRTERVSSPMAHPDTLVHLMDWTLDRLFDELRQPQMRLHTVCDDQRGPAQSCACGKNPLLAYFSTVEQAVVEALLVTDAHLESLSLMEKRASLQDLKHAVHAVARR